MRHLWPRRLDRRGRLDLRSGDVRLAILSLPAMTDSESSRSIERPWARGL